jgi:hypothetical protein
MNVDAKARPRLAKVCEVYEDLAERSLERWERASLDIRDRTYTPQKLISDAAAMWMDVTEAWIFSLRLAQGAVKPEPRGRGAGEKRS